MLFNNQTLNAQAQTLLFGNQGAAQVVVDLHRWMRQPRIRPITDRQIHSSHSERPETLPSPITATSKRPELLGHRPAMQACSEMSLLGGSQRVVGRGGCCPCSKRQTYHLPRLDQQSGLEQSLSQGQSTVSGALWGAYILPGRLARG